VVGGIQIPGLQSALAGHSQLPGLSSYPQSDWPPLIIHDTFDTMVLAGFLLGLFLLAFTGLWAAGRKPYDRRLLAYGFGFFAFVTLVIMELGWMTDELGRQPWIVYNVLKVSQAANYSTSLFYPGLVIVAFYVVLLPTTFYFMIRTFNGRSFEADLEGTAEGQDVNY